MAVVRCTDKDLKRINRLVKKLDRKAIFSATQELAINKLLNTYEENEKLNEKLDHIQVMLDSPDTPAKNKIELALHILNQS